MYTLRRAQALSQDLELSPHLAAKVIRHNNLSFTQVALGTRVLCDRSDWVLVGCRSGCSYGN